MKQFRSSGSSGGGSSGSSGGGGVGGGGSGGDNKGPSGSEMPLIKLKWRRNYENFLI